MAFSLVTSVKAGTGSSPVTTASVDTTGADLIVLVVSSWNVISSVSDSKGNSWTPLTAYIGGTGRQQAFYCASPTVGSGHTFTATSAGGYPSICVLAFSGVDTADPFDAETGTTGTGTTSQAGSITPTNDNSLVVACIGFWDGSTRSLSSVDGGFTLQETVPKDAAFGSGAAYLVQGAKAAANPTATYSASVGSWEHSSAVFNPAGAASRRVVIS